MLCVYTWSVFHGLSPPCAISLPIRRHQLRSDTVIASQAEEFASKLGIDDFNFHIGDPHGWRCRARLAVRGSSRHPIIGLFKQGTHDAINIPGSTSVMRYSLPSKHMLGFNLRCPFRFFPVSDLQRPSLLICCETN
jgi:hypothetical protein